MAVYTVKQGDYLAKIAAKFGLTNVNTIWDDPQNARLKQLRKNSNVLFPGDQLFIPDRKSKQEVCISERRHQFQLTGRSLILRIVLENAYNKPISDAHCELSIEDETFQLTSDAKGKIEQRIPENAQKATLTIKDPKTPINDEVIPIQIGYLDPVEEVSGQKARLNNLGYFAGPLDKEDEDIFRSAVEEFQCENMGKNAVDGKCGPMTQAKLLELHGC